MAVEDRLKWRIAMEAARIMAEEGIEDHGLAKKKAAARMGGSVNRHLPGKEDIEAALIEHHRLFAPSEHPRRLTHLRTLALEAMRFLSEFSPLLVGGIWSGSAGKFSPIRLHVFPDTAETLMLKLMSANIPFEEKSHSLPPDAGLPGEQPALHFYVDGIRVELLIFPMSWKGRSLGKKTGAAAGGGIKDLLRLMEDPAQHERPI
jgi:hypothetical protein